MNKKSILMFLRVYYYKVLFPLALVLLLIGSYGMIMNPSLFIAKKTSCYGNYFQCDQSPETTSLQLFGKTIGPEKTIPLLSEEEFEKKKDHINKINFWINISLFLVGVGLVMRMVSYYNENKKKEF